MSSNRMEEENNKEEVILQPIKLSTQCLNKCVKYPYESLVCCDRGSNNIVNNKDYYEDDESHAMDIDIDTKDCAGTLTPCKFNPEKLILKPAKFIPDSICEPLFQQVLKQHSEQYMNIFLDTTKCRLTKIDLSLQQLSYKLNNTLLMSKLFFHPLHEINLSGCSLSLEELDALKYCSSSLKVLDLSSVSGLKDTLILKDMRNLLKLNVSNTDIGFHEEQMNHIGTLKDLVWLDFSSSNHVIGFNLEKLIPLGSTLAWFSLYNCASVDDEDTLLKLIPHLTTLVHMDLSKDPPPVNQELTTKAPSPVVTSKILTALAKLPKLISLDISGSSGLSEEDLKPFTERSLKMKSLGLLFTGLSFHKNLPAEMATGESNEEQLLNALETYPNRQNYIAFALRKLFYLARLQSCGNIRKCLTLILTCMENYPLNETIHIAASASLYHLSRINDPANRDTQLRREVVANVLTSMSNLRSVSQLQKNCCLTLCHFKIPAELESHWFRVAELLLNALRNHRDDYLRRIAFMLFNAIVCQVTGHQRRDIGVLGAVKTILLIIQEKVESNEADQMLETCWSSLWNMTDEAPENCRDYLDGGGMTMFVKCLELFPDAVDLHRNMMGLMGNVAEVPELRCRLMIDEYINIFVSLLSDKPRQLEICYNAAGLLSHILSEGPDVWMATSITRTQCMETMFGCIEKWDIQSYRNINYRSFKPIMRLLTCQHAPAAQHWAIWALANLTKVYPHKYCKLFEEEDGLMYLEYVIHSATTHTRTKQLAEMIKENCNQLCLV